MCGGLCNSMLENCRNSARCIGFRHRKSLYTQYDSLFENLVEHTQKIVANVGDKICTNFMTGSFRHERQRSHKLIDRISAFLLFVFVEDHVEFGATSGLNIA